MSINEHRPLFVNMDDVSGHVIETQGWHTHEKCSPSLITRKWNLSVDGMLLLAISEEKPKMSRVIWVLSHIWAHVRVSMSGLKDKLAVSVDITPSLLLVLCSLGGKRVLNRSTDAYNVSRSLTFLEIGDSIWYKLLKVSRWWKQKNTELNLGISAGSLVIACTKPARDRICWHPWLELRQEGA